MSWKNVKLFRLQSCSLVTKLMIFYSVSTIALISAIGIFLYPTFLKMLEKTHGEQISDISAECFTKFIITLLLSSLAAIFFGYFIARNGLARVREFEETMEKITINSLHERINLNEWPKELKQLANKFNTMLNRLQMSFNQLSQFSSDIAHELRNPLNNLRGITELALTNKKYNEDYRQLLEKYMNEYQHLSKLIENLLFLARSDHGQLELNKTEISVQTEIMKIYDYYQAMADEHQISFICTGDAILRVDVILFKRMINNLISNALKYTKSQGKIHAHISTENSHVKISIQDTGIGIATNHLPLLFDRFYRVDTARSTPSDSLGLGLAIVKSIVELHRGIIHIESDLNIGTTVCLKIPAQ